MDNRQWVKGWVERQNKDHGHGLTPKEVEKAATIGEAMFKGNVGVGHAADAGIEAVKKLRE
jgi:hypothetical protein